MATTNKELFPPWVALPIEQHVRTELERRAKNYGIAYPPNNTEYSVDYRGPQSPWIRCVSNTIVTSTSPGGSSRTGFVLYGGDLFDTKYGVNGKKQIIGYDLDGNPHEIDMTDKMTAQPFRPVPVVKGIDVRIKSNIYRFAIIRWDCHSLDQMDYMCNYFFTPGNTILLEWGWNNFNNESLIDLSKRGSIIPFVKYNNATGEYISSTSSDMFKEQINDSVRHANANANTVTNASIRIPTSVSSLENKSSKNEEFRNLDITSMTTRGIMDAYSSPYLFEDGTKWSGGNYDGMVGRIMNWSYTFNDSNMTYECTTEIGSNSKFYTGLSVRDLTYIMEQDDDSKLANTDGFADWFNKKLENQIKKAYRDNNHKIRKTVSLNGRAFIPNEYFSDVIGSSKSKANTKIYVSVGFFAELLSTFIPNSTPIQSKIEPINIEDVYIGAHLNMISTDKDVLIPNEQAPRYVPKNLLENTNEFPSAIKENSKVNANDPKSVADKLMALALNNDGKRQNLNGIINYNRSGAGLASYAFPEIKPADNNTTVDPQKFYKGKLTNIFISTDLIKSICQQNDILSILKALCSKLNAVGKIWKLDAICSDHNRIQIVDEKFTDISYLRKAKDQFGVESVLYFLDTTSQLSIAKNFKFDVKISDAIANQIVMRNQVNEDTEENIRKSQSGNETGDSRITFNVNTKEKVSDLIMQEVIAFSNQDRNETRREEEQKEINRLGQAAFEAKKAREKQKLEEERLEELGNIDSDSVSCEIEKTIFDTVQAFSQKIEKNVLGEVLTSPVVATENSKIYLTMPEKYSHKYQAMIFRDATAEFVNINGMPIPGTSVEFTISGIGGFKAFQIFGVKNLPKPYNNNIVFKITEVNQVIGDNGWNTTIIATIVPVKNLKIFDGTI